MMEILAIIGVVIIALFLFTGGGILGWMLKGLGSIFDLLLDGWSSLIKVVVWGAIIIMFLMSLFAL